MPVHRHHQRQAPRSVDDRLRRRTSCRRTRSIADLRYRFRPDVSACRPGQGQQGPLVSLSPWLLEHLREYWRRERPKHWLFLTRPLDRPMNRSTPARIYQVAKDKARNRFGRGGFLQACAGELVAPDNGCWAVSDALVWFGCVGRFPNRRSVGLRTAKPQWLTIRVCAIACHVYPQPTGVRVSLNTPPVPSYA